MAFPTDIALNGDTASSTTEGAITFSQVSLSNDGSVRRDSLTAMTQPHTLSIKHQYTKKGNVARARRVARLDRSITDTVNGPQGVAVYIVVDHPIQTAVTNANVKAAMGRLVALLSSGNMDKLLNGEP